MAAPQAVIAFHDAPIIHRAIWAFIAERRAAGEQVVAYPLPNHVFVVEIGDPRIWATRAIRSLVGDPRFPLPDPVADLLARRPVGGVARWPLLDAWLTRVGAGKPYLRKSAQRYRKRKQLKVQRRRMAKKRSARSTSCGATSASERVKLLFALTHAGLFRNFDSTLRELVARGHEVHVSFDTARYPSDAFTALEAASPALTSALSPPVVDDRWQVLGRHVRAASDYIRYRDPRYAGAPKLRRLRGLECTPRERLRSLLLKPYNRVAGFDDANRVRFLQALIQRGVVARVPKARDYTGRFRIDFPATALGLSLTRQIQQESECETLPFTFDFYAMRTAEPGVMF